VTTSEAQSIVHSELQPGESLQWSGIADPARAALSAWPSLFFRISFAGFAFLWISMDYCGTNAVSKSSSPMARGFSLFPLFGLPFLFIGLSIVSAPLIAYRKGLKTVCGVTDKRVLVITDGRSRTVRSCTAADMVSVDHCERAGGTGGVIIRTNSILQTRNSQMTVGLLSVNNVKEVVALF
jgi:hypothetical protein